MSNTKRNTASPNNAPAPKTLAEFYKHAHDTILNKMKKEEREALIKELNKADKPNHRGMIVWSAEVKKFVKNVAELGEEMYDKSLKPEPVKAKA